MNNKLNLFSKRKKFLFSLTLIFALLTMVLLPLPVSFAVPVTATPTGVDGRILTPDLTGDTSNWVEIARNGDYSLIVRANFINVYNAAARYGDPTWQYVPYGSSNTYTSSNVRNNINAWFNGVAMGAADNLSTNARLRNYTVQSNALSVLGTSCNPAMSLNDGFSQPSSYQVGKGNDVAFVLSYSEAATFLSKTHDLRKSNPQMQPSNTNAAANYAKIAIPQLYCYGMWLRSPGDVSGTMGALTYTGRVFQQYASPGSIQEYGLVYPALWVSSSIFETKGTVNVVHKDANSGVVLFSDTDSVVPGVYGPYGPMSFPGYDVGVLALDSDPASGVIAAGEVKNIVYLYTLAPVCYDVSVVNSYAVVTGAGSYASGSLVTVDAGLRSGYSFAGWSCQGIAALPSDSVVSFSMPANDVVITANWVPVLYDISYVLSTGTNAPGNPTVYTVENAHLLRINNPELRGYTFLYWMIVCANGTRFELTSAGIPAGTTGNLTAMAIWDPVPILYRISYVLDDGVGASGSPVEYAVTSVFPIDIGNPSRAGYSFLGWIAVYSNGTMSSLVSSYSIPAGSACDVTLYAFWSPIVVSYSIGYVLGGGGVNAVGNPVMYSVGGLPVSVAGASRAGYTFSY
ncbi:MAG: InlB B-repeat-containing protein, partial [Nitrososphaerota archaeon]|nr:InlB B-repeat-containing protein [Nitrososphaerota archaeon]